jgi:hypothetical protein
MPVEHLLRPKEPTETEITHAADARPNIIRQQIHVDVQITDDAVNRILVTDLLLVLLKETNVTVYRLVILPTGVVQEGHVEPLLLELLLNSTILCYTANRTLEQRSQFLLLLHCNLGFVSVLLVNRLFKFNIAVILHMALLNAHILYESQLLIANHNNLILGQLEVLRLLQDGEQLIREEYEVSKQEEIGRLAIRYKLLHNLLHRALRVLVVIDHDLLSQR